MTDRDRERIAKESRKSVGCGSVFSSPRATRKPAPIRPLLLLLRGDPGPFGRDLSAIKRSDKTAMFICGERAEKRKRKNEKCRVEGEIYLPAARADKIIRQKMPGVDDGEAKDGRMEKEKKRGREPAISQVRTKEERKSEERKRMLKR